MMRLTCVSRHKLLVHLSWLLDKTTYVKVTSVRLSLNIRDCCFYMLSESIFVSSVLDWRGTDR